MYVVDRSLLLCGIVMNISLLTGVILNADEGTVHDLNHEPWSWSLCGNSINSWNFMHTGSSYSNVIVYG